MNYKERLKNYLKGYSSQYNFKDKNGIEHDLNDDIKEMLKENENLKKELSNARDVIDTTIELSNWLTKKTDKQQEVFNQAIEYIKETTKRNDELNCTKLLSVNQVEKLLNILEGGIK